MRSKPPEDQFQSESEPVQTRSFHTKKQSKHNPTPIVIQLHLILVLGKEGRRGYILQHFAEAITVNLAVSDQNLAKLPFMELDLDTLP